MRFPIYYFLNFLDKIIEKMDQDFMKLGNMSSNSKSNGKYLVIISNR